ncbi:spore germination protein (amino acid permease) [Natronincola peptidivorans]|uniref:Spore germination protein (Amino acid permease) n=1 Tax=Natronincola peptidivorans TaxID=426128 RepID=A0A1I0EAZ7_9FIRM|nr:endospore germination permease [Natronincola peptidivorans]SET42244.1 spore germination protein (amino acid permease) [Natronincola peptidivorans]
MYKMKEQLDSINMLAFVIHGMVGVRLLTLPRDIVQYAENDGWMSVILATILAFLTGFAFYWLGTIYPKLNISQIAEVVLGKVFGKMIMMGIALYVGLSISMSLRSFADNIKLFLLDTTPLWVIITLMLLISFYCVSQGVKAIAIVLDIILPFTLVFVALLILLALTNADTKNLMPVFYGGPKPVFRGFLEIVHPFLGVGTIGYIMPYFQIKKAVKKWITIGILIVGVVYMAIVLMCIMVFGSREIQELLFPTLSLSKTIQLQVEMFERAESLFMAVWIPITFTTIVTYFFSSFLNMKALLNTKREKMVLYGHLPILFIAALIPQNTVEVHYYLMLTNELAKILSFAALPLIVIATFIKERRRRPS